MLKKDGEPSGRAAAFEGFIAPVTLLAQVRATAPYLFDAAPPADPEALRGCRLADLAASPGGWLEILRHGAALPARATPSHEERTDYLALCLAAHFASVMTFVPTDVDTKIRQHYWFVRTSDAEWSARRRLVLALPAWNLERVSRRTLSLADGETLSGHDGERLGVWAGAMLGMLAAGREDDAAAMEDAIEAELAREARAFDRLSARRDGELDLLRAAAILAHNAGDVDQGLAAKGGAELGGAARSRFARLAHERFERYGGAFGRAAALYRPLLAAEGHRNYPLRAVKALRRDPELLLPLGPCLDAWGGLIARHPSLKGDERAEIVDALVAGCQRTPGQAGYYRALAGFAEAFPGGLDSADLAKRLGAATRRELRGSDLRRLVAVRRGSFESSLAKRARAIMAEWPKLR